MPKIIYYPTPASKVAVWRDLFDAAGVDARSSSHIFPLPLASAADQRAAELHIEVDEVEAKRRGLQLPSGTERRRRVRYLAARYHHARRIAENAVRSGATHVAVWNGTGGRRNIMLRAATEAGLQGLFAELSPFPGYLTLDPRGVNAAGSLPGDPGYYRNWAAAHPGVVDLSPFRSSLRARPGVRRANQGSLKADPFVFVPLQVHGDTQVDTHGGWIKDIPMLIEELAKAAEHLPTGWRLVFREHPSCRVGNAEQLQRLLGARVSVDNETDTFELARRSQAVVTLNSSVGLQSLLLSKPVLVLGNANYALSGLTERAASSEELQWAFAAIGEWQVDEPLRQAFLGFLLAEYFIRHPADDRARLGDQVRLRLDGRITDWHGLQSADAN